MKSASYILLFLTLFACKKDTKQVSVDFYHWKTHLEVGEREQALLETFRSERLYLRFFDVDHNTVLNKPLPKATVQAPDNLQWPDVEIVPVVYLTNAVFRQMDRDNDATNLAKEVFDKILRLRESLFPPDTAFPEIQLDCDWTDRTQERYFVFLKAFRQLMADTFSDENIPQLTCTLRLHQVKYREKTGIPPVDKAVLMLYNMGDLGRVDEPNSILNLETTHLYLERLDDYPLPLALALPFYEWGVLYREGRLAGILNGMDEKQLTHTFTPTENTQQYTATRDTYLSNTFVYEGDLLRWETVDTQKLKELMKHIKTASDRDFQLILYHLHSPLLNPTANETLKELFF